EQLINACSVSDKTSDTLSETSGTHIFNGDDNATWAFPTPSAGNPIKVIKNKTAAKSLTIQGPESNKLWTFQQVSSVVIGPGESATFQWDGTHWTEVRIVLPDNLQRVVPKTAHGFAVKNVITLDYTGAYVKVSDPDADKFV